MIRQPGHRNQPGILVKQRLLDHHAQASVHHQSTADRFTSRRLAGSHQGQPVLTRPRTRHTPLPLGQCRHPKSLDQPVGLERQRQLLADSRQILMTHRDHIRLLAATDPKPEPLGIRTQVHLVGTQQRGPETELTRTSNRDVGRKRHRQTTLRSSTDARGCRTPRGYPLGIGVQMSDHLLRCRLGRQPALRWTIRTPADLLAQRTTTHRRQQGRQPQQQQQTHSAAANSTHAASAHSADPADPRFLRRPIGNPGPQTAPRHVRR